MLRIMLISLLGQFLFPSYTSAQESDGMNNIKMQEIFQEVTDSLEGELGAWQFFVEDYLMIVLTDEYNNRMRIFSPVIEEKDIDKAEMRKMLMANFHTALDAKYSLYNGFVISTFTHPLQELTKSQLLDAIRQVANLAATFGTTYSSTELLFGGGLESEENPADKRINQSPSKKKRL